MATTEPDSIAIGKAAEDRALEFLRGAGLRVVARNFRCREGEIDLIMRDGKALVFVEVRHRRNARHGAAVESVTVHKQRKLLRAAAVFIARNPACGNQPMRFDLVTLDGSPPVIAWHHNAITNELDD